MAQRFEGGQQKKAFGAAKLFQMEPFGPVLPFLEVVFIATERTASVSGVRRSRVVRNRSNSMSFYVLFIRKSLPIDPNFFWVGDVFTAAI